MPGPRRTLAVAVCAAVVGLFLVAGVGVAQAATQHRATAVHTSSTAHHAAHVRAAGDHVDHLLPDLWSVPPVEALPVPPVPRSTTDDQVATAAPAQRSRPVGRGPPAA